MNAVPLPFPGRSPGVILFPGCPCGCGPCGTDQPDGQAPDRLLAICGGCGAWQCSVNGGGSWHRVMPPVPRAPGIAGTPQDSLSVRPSGAAESA